MKKILIGIDVSKEKYDATAISVENGLMEVVKLDYQVFENRPSGFKKMLSWAKKLKPEVEPADILFACETTGAYDRAMCDYIYSHGMDIWRESALQIKKSSGVRKGKNDKADSMMIAEYAMRHMDKVLIYKSPDPRIMEIRALFLYRRKLEHERRSKATRMKEIKALSPDSESISFIVKDAEESVKALDKSIAECEERIRKLIDEDEKLSQSYKHLDSIKGIGIVNATALIVFTNNFKNFRTARKIASYWGVAAFRDESGKTIDKRADVSCYSSSMLKEYITDAAACTIKSGGLYVDYYARLIAAGKPHNVALNNIKNKLIHLAFSLVQNDADYEANHEFLRAQRKNDQHNTQN